MFRAGAQAAFNTVLLVFIVVILLIDPRSFLSKYVIGPPVYYEVMPLKLEKHQLSRGERVGVFSTLCSASDNTTIVSTVWFERVDSSSGAVTKYPMPSTARDGIPKGCPRDSQARYPFSVPIDIVGGTWRARGVLQAQDWLGTIRYVPWETEAFEVVS
jgi:hypothetical protein